MKTVQVCNIESEINKEFVYEVNTPASHARIKSRMLDFLEVNEGFALTVTEIDKNTLIVDILKKDKASNV